MWVSVQRSVQPPSDSSVRGGPGRGPGGVAGVAGGVEGKKNSRCGGAISVTVTAGAVVASAGFATANIFGTVRRMLRQRRVRSFDSEIWTSTSRVRAFANLPSVRRLSDPITGKVAHFFGGVKWKTTNRLRDQLSVQHLRLQAVAP